MAVTRPSAPLKNKTNVNPVVNRPTEATAEDFQEVGALLDEYADALDLLLGSNYRADFLGYFGSKALLEATFPAPPENSFGIVVDQSNNPVQIWRYTAGAYVLVQGSDNIKFYNSRNSFPATGEVGVLYISKNSLQVYGWWNSRYYNLSLNEEENQKIAYTQLTYKETVDFPTYTMTDEFELVRENFNEVYFLVRDDSNIDLENCRVKLLENNRATDLTSPDIEQSNYKAYLVNLELYTSILVDGDTYNFTFWRKVLPKQPIPFYDATIGTGADYATIQTAVNAGAGKLKLISDLTITADVVLPADFDLVIDLNGFVLTFNLNVKITRGATVKITDYATIRGGELVFSTNTNNFQGISNAESEAKNITIRNISTVSLNSNNLIGRFFKEHYDCIYYFPNAENHSISHADNCELIAGGINSRFIFNNAEIKNCKISGTSKANDFLGNADYLYNCIVTVSNDFVLSASYSDNVEFINGNQGTLVVNKQGSNLYGIRSINPLSNASITNFKCLKMSIRNRTKVKVSNGIIQLADINSGGASNSVFVNVDFQSNLSIGNMSYSSFTDCQCVSIYIAGNSDYNVFRNIQYTTTAVDDSLTTREWDVYQN